MTWWQAIIFGLIQGLTEFLPVSSSGHLVLAEKVMNLNESDLLTFYSLLHMGTLIAVLIVMKEEVFSILKNIFGKLTGLLIISSIPAIIFSVLFMDFIDQAFKGGGLGFGFIFTGALLLSTLFLKEGHRTVKKMTWKDALIVGIAQAIAILPAISRSGSTLSALLFLKMKREAAIRYVFLMSIPVILGSFLLDLIKIIKGEYVIASGQGFNMILGVIMAGISGYVVMRFMLKKLNRQGIFICGAYVGILGIFILLDQSLFHLIF